MRSTSTSSSRKGKTRRATLLSAAVVLALLPLAGCEPTAFSDAEKKQIASLSLAALPPLPPDPSNRVAQDPRAAAFGEALFFDTGFSPNDGVACATCHVPERHFQDDLPLARGIGRTNRRTMPLSGVAWSPWQFWDGRADSLWAQALGPMENPVEHGGNRTAFVRAVAQEHRDAYEALFGPLPDVEGLPENAGPFGGPEEKQAWDALTPERRDAVNRVFSNLGKAIAAFERTLAPEPTRFDRFAAAVSAGEEPAGEAAFDDLELEGLKLFIGKANCIDCHNGPRLTDDHFHNTGVPAADGLPEDRGRAGAIATLLADPFNCLGSYSDAQPDECGEIRFMLREGHELERAFKTPSLRGVAGRPPYMHSGQIATLEEVIDHYSRAPAAPVGHTELDPVVLTERGRQALIAFLKTLDPVSGEGSVEAGTNGSAGPS
ncbi:cytochrome-c peroxidase [Aquibium oceanicum]|uniref:Methylamine utilization protein n=1 Tax=Aquibium oceanicum TaxID=1670800 RepID=A0A1L3SS75_9HYPH|nr:cytochrome c peroxidase [Aquibium oceanicum]APH72165.1 methylamine utilization protein [Aquibium oceanicum]